MNKKSLQAAVLSTSLAFGLGGCASTSLISRDVDSSAIQSATIYTNAHKMMDGSTKVGDKNFPFTIKKMESMYEKGDFNMPNSLSLQYGDCKVQTCKDNIMKQYLLQHENNTSMKGYALRDAQENARQYRENWYHGLIVREAVRTASLITILGAISGHAAHNATTHEAPPGNGSTGSTIIGNVDQTPGTKGPSGPASGNLEDVLNCLFGGK